MITTGTVVLYADDVQDDVSDVVSGIITYVDQDEPDYPFHVLWAEFKEDDLSSEQLVEVQAHPAQ